MAASANVTLPSERDLRRFQRWILFRLRWATIAVLLLITLLMPTSSYVAFPIWMLVLAFAAYNLLHDALRRLLGRADALAQLVERVAAGLRHA